ncbi:Acyl-coenzyme A thioesterase 13 [Mycena venus]|uniref:Acyl-coenzyme A thioesterase 13 n=1 Tax=Mycena venus TaxID=2733690 RepID=A0A8H7DAG0_9AGAR|nr:Acyl-coenzyme A thioesterase 13 [Mycena venus]
MKITGNADESFKQSMLDFPSFLDRTGRSRFGDSIIQVLVVTHASVEKNADEPLKTEGKVICELVVTEDMLNGEGNVHGGCSAYLIDMCSTLVLMACGHYVHVSQSLNVVYHSPATLGEKLRIVNTTMTIGRRTMTARTEIWNATKHRLVASGVHIKMVPSPSKL